MHSLYVEYIVYEYQVTADLLLSFHLKVMLYEAGIAT
jgi:hypothetical protein